MLTKGRRGFSLLEAIMAIAVIAVVAGIVVPAIAGRQQDQDTKDAAAMLLKIETGLGANNVTNSFRNKVTVNAGRISQLGEAPLSTDTTSCTSTTFGGNAAKWADPNAPWLYRAVSEATGLPTGIGTIQDRLIRNPPNAATAGTISAIILKARYEDALRLNEILDTTDVANGDGSNRQKKVQFTAPVNRVVDTLYYMMQIDNKC